ASARRRHLTYPLSAVDACSGGPPEHGRVEADDAPCGALSRQLSLINETIARFAPGDSLPELVRQAPVLLCVAGDFDRAMISRVRGSTWTPTAVHVAVGIGCDLPARLCDALRALAEPLTGDA